MRRIQVVESDAGSWRSTAVAGAETRVVFGGADAQLGLHEARLVGDSVVEPHSHDADEIIYVTDGSLLIGRQVVGPGGAIFIAAHTLYGFRAGPDGAAFANFRPRGDVRFQSKAEHLAARDSSATSIRPGAT